MPASPQWSIEPRDYLLALSLVISVLSFALHWIRGRKIVAFHFSEAEREIPRDTRDKRGRKLDGVQRLKVNLLINNETRWPIEIVYEAFHQPRHTDAGIAWRMSGGGRRQVVQASSNQALSFSTVPDWDALLVASATPRWKRSIFRSLPSNDITLSLNMRSRAFWLRKRKMIKRMTIPKSMIEAAIRQR